jgi:hypothetical protein
LIAIDVDRGDLLLVALTDAAPVGRGTSKPATRRQVGSVDRPAGR